MILISYHRLGSFEEYEIYPANLFVTSKEQTEIAIRNIQDDLVKQIDFFNEAGDSIKAQRIKERVEYDVEMIKELGHCSGIENYSRYFDGREEGQRPYCSIGLLFQKDNLYYYLMKAMLVFLKSPRCMVEIGHEKRIWWNLVSDYQLHLIIVR